MVSKSDPPRVPKGVQEQAPDNGRSYGKQGGPKLALTEPELNCIKALRAIRDVAEQIDAAKQIIQGNAGRGPITAKDWSNAFNQPITARDMAEWRLKIFDKERGLPWADGHDETVKQDSARYITDAHCAVNGAFTAAAALRKKLYYVFSRGRSGAADFRWQDYEASGDYLREQFAQLVTAISGARHALSSVQVHFMNARVKIAAALKLDEPTVRVGGASYSCFHQAALCTAAAFVDFGYLIDPIFVNVVRTTIISFTKVFRS
jgi:hypothetical protein